MAVAVDTAEGGTSLSFAHTCNGSDRYLTVEANIGDAGVTTVTGITYGVGSFSKLGSAVSAGGGFSTELWGLVAPATGSNTITISLSGANPGGAFGAISFTGVDQTNPTDGAAVTASGVGTPIATATKTGASGDMLVDSFAADVASTIRAPAIRQWNVGSGDAGGTQACDGSALAITWDATSGTSYATVMALIKQVSAAPSGTSQPSTIPAIGWLGCGVRRAWHRRRSGILVPDYAI